MSRSSGKALPLESDILTKRKNGTSGYIKFKDLKVGDVVYDKDSKETKVIQLHPIIFEDVYEVEFEDGSVVECGPEHLWSVYDFSVGRGALRKAQQMEKLYVLETQEMMGEESLRPDNGSYRFATPINKPLEFSTKKQIIEPYLLGLWLGDGFFKRREIASDLQDVDEQIEILKSITTEGWEYSVGGKEKDNFRYIKISHPKDGVEKNSGLGKEQKKYEFTRRLDLLGVYGNKYIPDEYLYGDYNQRIELIRGLFDSDGHCNKNGNFEFAQKDNKLAEQVYFILRSLGIKCYWMKIKNKTRVNKLDSHINRIGGFASKEQPLFKLSRKFNRQHEFYTPKTKYKAIKKITKANRKIPMRCITVDSKSGTFLTGKQLVVTHNSFLSSPMIMARSLLFPNHNTYILGPSGGQSAETFGKLESLAKGEIASVLGVSSFFLDECVRMNSKADPFTHDKSGHQVKLYNGSTVNSLNSVAKNIVGIRSNFNVYDEAGKITKDFFALTVPFTVQDADFVTGGNFNAELFPPQIQNKNLYLSSAENTDSELWFQYSNAFHKMLLGDPNYFVCDIDCSLSLHPFINGKPSKPLVSQDNIDDAFATNPYKATREYMNIFDSEGGMNVFVGRTAINKTCQLYYPEYEGDGKSEYIIAYDPASKIDNSVILIGKIIEDEDKGLMLKFVNGKNLREVRPNGEKVVIQKPKQVEILKDFIVDFNKGREDYDGIYKIPIDAGAGG